MGVRERERGKERGRSVVVGWRDYVVLKDGGCG
jgi:hypothetical protein